ncbi:MAG: S-layer homology domain-containing protein [Oscillospiraceae bacterium]|nr:S-layer homology domain-containing protein [Oscillospiraceae bacterium]
MKKKIIALLLVLSLIPGVFALAAEAPAIRSLNDVLVLEDGTILASDGYNKVILAFREGEVSVYAGAMGFVGVDGLPEGYYYDADYAHAHFASPCGMAVMNGGIAVADTDANVIRYLKDGLVRTLCGNGEAGSADGTAAAASFNMPTGLCQDGNGGLYIADTGNDLVRHINSNGIVSTVPAVFDAPKGLAFRDGVLYIVESGKNRVVTWSDDKITVLSGAELFDEDGVRVGGYRNGKAETALYDAPMGIAVGENGVVYVSDPLNHAVRAIKNGRVNTLAESKDLITGTAEPNLLKYYNGSLLAADGITGEVTVIGTGVKPFRDVNNDPYVSEARERGLIYGITDEIFAPDGTTTRAQFVTMLSRIERYINGAAVIDGEKALEDVKDGAWFAETARWSVDAGIVVGIGKNFEPGRKINHEQAVTMLYRFAQALGVDVSEGENTNILSYDDAFELHTWAASAYQWAVSAGLIPDDATRLGFAEPLTRAQAAKLLVTFMDKCGI